MQLVNDTSAEQVATDACDKILKNVESNKFEQPQLIKASDKKTKFQNQSTQTSSADESQVYLNVTYNIAKTKVKNCCSSKFNRYYISTGTVIILILVIIIISRVTTMKKFDFTHPRDLTVPKELSTDTTTPSFPPLVSLVIPSIVADKELQIVTRKEWKARPPKGRSQFNFISLRFIVISETGTELCLNKSQCMQSVREVQAQALAKENYDDIENHFLIGGDGLIYEGRGWNVLPQVSNTFTDQLNFGVSFIGNFSRDTPTQVQLNAALLLINFGVRQRMIANGCKLKAFKYSQPINPGANLFGVIKTWKGWKSDIGYYPGMIRVAAVNP